MEYGQHVNHPVLFAQIEYSMDPGIIAGAQEQTAESKRPELAAAILDSV